MKKAASLILALALAACLFYPAQTRAQEDENIAQIAIASVDGALGAQAEVAVTIANCAGVDSAQFDLNYDPSALSVLAVIPGDAFPVEYCIYNADTAGVIRVACACAEGLKSDGTIITIRFQILSAAGSAFTMTNGMFTRIDEAYAQSESYAVLENGGVTVGGAAMPQAQVTPWIPKTPEPTPTPTPEPTEEPTFEGDILSATPSSETLGDADSTGASAPEADAVAYVVVGVLFAMLLVLIVVSTRRNAKKKNKRRASSRKRKD